MYSYICASDMFKHHINIMIQIKQENRKGEFLLHDVDFVSAVAYASKSIITHSDSLAG